MAHTCDTCEMTCKTCGLEFVRYNTITRHCPKCRIDKKRKRDADKKTASRKMGHRLLPEIPTTGTNGGTRTKDKKAGRKDGIAKVSAKQAKINSKLAKVYAEITYEREACCEGCGSRYGLTPSHAIPRAKRKDLETDKEGISILCLQCHDWWEHQHPNAVKLLNFAQMILYVKRVDTKRYLHITERLKLKG